MLKLSHATLIFISGIIWLGVGCFLLPLGLKLLLSAMQNPVGSYPLINSLTAVVDVSQAVLLLIAIGLLIGHFKGKYVLGKSVKRGVSRIQTFPNPTELTNLYSLKYYILLAFMVGLGMSIKYFGVPNDVRGLVDVAVGAALINGALMYFRLALAARKTNSVVTEQ